MTSEEDRFYQFTSRPQSVLVDPPRAYAAAIRLGGISPFLEREIGYRGSSGLLKLGELHFFGGGGDADVFEVFFGGGEAAVAGDLGD